MIKDIVTGIFSPIANIIDDAVPDRDLANRLKQEVRLAVLDYTTTELEAAARVIVAEARGESWLQRNWRPITMLTIVGIVANNYIVYPYASVVFGFEVPLLELPSELFTLMTTGLGGYVVGRTVEKVGPRIAASVGGKGGKQ